MTAERDALVKLLDELEAISASYDIASANECERLDIEKQECRDKILAALTAQPSAGEPVAWMNPMNSAVIDARKKKQSGEGAGYPNFSVPLLPAPSESSPETVVVPMLGHYFSDKETDRHLLRAYTSTQYYGDYPDYFNLTMLRMDGSVVLTVRLPTKFGMPEGATATVRFRRELWREFVKAIPEANKVYEASDFLDDIY